MECEGVMAWTRLFPVSDNGTAATELSVTGGGGAGYHGPVQVYSDNSTFATWYADNIQNQGIPWVDPEPEPREWRCAYCDSLVAYKPAEDGKISCPHCSAPKEE